jgi:hypothetical protein
MKVLLRFLVFIIVVVLLIVFLQLRAHVPQSSALPQATLGESYPSMGDTGSYAENEGISVDGALQRSRMTDIAGRLDADLTANETETFAGLWIEHSPEFKIVVLFTENPQQTLQPYLSKDYMTKEVADILDVRTARVSLAELVRVQTELLSSLEDLDIHAGSAEVNVFENNILMFLNQANKRAIDQAVENGLVEVPDYVVVKAIPEWGSEPEEPPSLGDHFPRQKHTVGGLEALMTGELVLENGCLRVKVSSSYAPTDETSVLIIWDLRFSTRTEDGVVQLIDSQTENVLAKVGDVVQMGGGYVPTPTYLGLVNPLPDDCPGPYWLISEFAK